MTRIDEDRLGRFAMIAIFGVLFLQQIISIAVSFELRDEITLWPLALLSQLCGLVFVGLIVAYTVTRLPPRESAGGIMPRVVSIMGTFVMMFLVAVAPEPIGPVQRIVSTVFIIIGTCLSIWCLNQLGRSFSIMATSRELKTEGSYSLVRHPLYGSEVMLILGVVLAHSTPFAYALGFIWLLLQIRRAQYEEGILRQTFPEYDDYARRVPMLIPSVWKLR